MFLLVDRILAGSGVKYRRTGCVFHSQGGRKSSCVFTYGPVTLPCTFLSVWAEDLEPTNSNLSATQTGRVTSPGVDCRLLTCVDGFPACQISRLHRRPRGAVGGAQGTQGFWSVAVVAESDVAAAERESAIIPLWLRRGEARVFGNQVQATPACVPSTSLN